MKIKDPSYIFFHDLHHVPDNTPVKELVRKFWRILFVLLVLGVGWTLMAIAGWALWHLPGWLGRLIGG
jgi:hypothetical protein